LRGRAGAVDPSQRVVVRAEHVEEVVADEEVADVGAAPELHHHRDAGHVPV